MEIEEEESYDSEIQSIVQKIMEKNSKKSNGIIRINNIVDFQDFRESDNHENHISTIIDDMIPHESSEELNDDFLNDEIFGNSKIEESTNNNSETLLNIHEEKKEEPSTEKQGIKENNNEILLNIHEEKKEEPSTEKQGIKENNNEILLNIHEEKKEDVIEEEPDIKSESELNSEIFSNVSDEGEEEEEEYEVEAIVSDRIKKGKKQYLLKWKGYPDSENTWEDEESLNCPDLLLKYIQKKESQAYDSYDKPKPRNVIVKERINVTKKPKKYNLPEIKNEKDDSQRYRILDVKKSPKGCIYEIEMTTKIGGTIRKKCPSNFVKDTLGSRLLVDFLCRMYQPNSKSIKPLA